MTAKSGALQHTYIARGAALEAMHNRTREILLCGPAGTGKSRALLEKLHLLMLANPGARGLIVRKYQRSLGSTALDTWRKAVIPEALAAGLVKFYGGSAEQPAQYIYLNGSVVLVGGLDTTGDQPPKVMSSEYDVIYCQEATELAEADWEALISRLRNWRISFQQVIADCNPGPPTHWLKRRCDTGKTVMLHSRHRDNPRLWDEAAGAWTEQGAEYMAGLESLTGVRRLRLLDGQWAAAEGLIFEGFDPAVHVVPRFTIPASWPRIWGVDFGHTNPMVVQCWARDPDGRLVLYREWYETKRLVEDMARKIMRTVAPGGAPDSEGIYRGGAWIEPRPVAVVCDHDAGDRATLEKHLGMGTTAARKDVGTGIQAFQKRLEVPADGRPRLTIFSDALVERDPHLWDAKKPTSTVEEFPGYVWAVKPGGDLKEEPRKENDHGLDTARYIIQYEDRYARAGTFHIPGQGG
jgi:phage terminase large subunit